MIVAHADESFVNPGGRYLVVLIQAGEPGYWVRDDGVQADHATLAEAKAAADVFNTDLGLTAEQVLEARITSMAAHIRAAGR